jgi:hypothetical protein
VTVHWNDAKDWSLKSHEIAVKPLAAPHTAMRIARALKDVIDCFLDDSKMIVAVVTDGGHNFLNAAAILVDGADAVYCIEHRLQLIVNDVLRKNIGAAKCFEDITAMRDLVDMISMHGKLHDALYYAQQQVGVTWPLHLIKDDVMRWILVNWVCNNSDCMFYCVAWIPCWMSHF